MTVPRGEIWDEFRQEALDSIPEGVVKDLSSALTFYEWREKGGYIVTGTTGQNFHVSCATKEYGGMVAREVNELLDQALEHRLLIADTFRQGKTPSQSWLLVTTYYWCLFLALAWLRLVGKIITYLPTTEIDNLKELGSSNHKKTKTPKSPGAGTYTVTVNGTTGARSLLIYHRLKSNNFHDGLWQAFYADIDQRLLSVADTSLNSEYHLFSTLSHRNKFDKTAWLSRLRNAVNYRIGFAYGSVGGRNRPQMLDTLVAIKSASFHDLVKELEIAQSSTADRPVFDRPDQYSRVMILFGSVLTHMLEEYSAEIWKIRAIDPSRAKKRNIYANHFNETSNTLWPF